MTVILGIDPGLAATGYGILRLEGNRFTHLAHGVIRTPADMVSGRRLLLLFDELTQLIHTYHPQEAGVESLYFARNATSAIPVAQARGVVLLALSRAGMSYAEYPPQAIKQGVVGSGRAAKEQVQELVRVILGLDDIPRPDHAADALAAAICHGNTSHFQSRAGRAAGSEE